MSVLPLKQVVNPAVDIAGAHTANREPQADTVYEVAKTIFVDPCYTNFPKNANDAVSSLREKQPKQEIELIELQHWPVPLNCPADTSPTNRSNTTSSSATSSSATSSNTTSSNATSSNAKPINSSGVKQALPTIDDLTSLTKDLAKQVTDLDSALGDLNAFQSNINKKQEFWFSLVCQESARQQNSLKLTAERLTNQTASIIDNIKNKMVSEVNGAPSSEITEEDFNNNKAFLSELREHISSIDDGCSLINKFFLQVSKNLTTASNDFGDAPKKASDDLQAFIKSINAKTGQLRDRARCFKVDYFWTRMGPYAGSNRFGKTD